MEDPSVARDLPMFVISFIVIGIMLGVLSYLKKKERTVKGHARIVQGPKIAPFLIVAIEYVIYAAEVNSEHMRSHA